MAGKFSYTLSSSEKISHNDKVIPGSPFLLSGYSYVFSVQPKCQFWRFGIRLSEIEEIEFFHPEHRYQTPEFDKYADLHIGVGNWDNVEWFSPNQLELKQYNIDESLGQIDFRSEKYEPETPVVWTVSMDGRSDFVKTSLWVKDQLVIERNFPVTHGLDFFKVFAWADGSGFELDIDIEVTNLHEDELDFPLAIKFGNLAVYNAEIESEIETSPARYIVVPTYEDGKALPGYTKILEKFHVDFQPDNSKTLYETNFIRGKQKTFLLGLTFPSLGTITPLIVKNIYLALLSRLREANKNQLVQVIMPILDLNQRGVSPTIFLKIYDEVFNNNIESFHISLITNSNHTYDQILNDFTGKYLDASKIQKSNEIVNIEKRLRTKLWLDEAELDQHGLLVKLVLKKVDDITFLSKLAPRVAYLTLTECKIENLSILAELKSLKQLEIEYSYIVSLAFLTSLHRLKGLAVKSTGLVDLSGIQTQPDLEWLDLSFNHFSFIDQLSELKKLQWLSLNDTGISDLSPIFSLNRLRHLEAASNEIENIDGIGALQNLEHLTLLNNQISDISELVKLKKLRTITIQNNPWEKIANIVLPPFTNHLITINNFLLRQNEENKKSFVAPVKVLLLGNHASGKSSLLDYLRDGRIKSKMDSTHIIRLEKYPKAKKGIPKAVFFDFGGQDYYHGIYRAFLTGRSIYLMLWNPGRNKNEKHPDSRGYTNQNYHISYWMAQRTYLVNQKFEGKRVCPTFLIQSHIDESGKHYPELKDYNNLQIRNEFAISLHHSATKSSLYKSGLVYVKQSIDDEINRFAKKDDQPEWYIKFIDYILQQISSNGHEPISLTEIQKYYGRGGMDIESFLMDDLLQLHEQGLVLYYPEITSDHAWLNPAALVTFIHKKILTKKIIQDGHIKKSALAKFDPKIIQFLVEQKVLFENTISGGDNFIVPNFLPLVSESQSEFDLMAFGLDEISFVLKFYQFMPFGLINQLIGFFGTKGDLKKYWRDQLLFTLEKKSKVLIRIDMDKLEIKVNIQHHKSVDIQRQKQIVAYLFYSIVSCYWDFAIFEFEDFLNYRSGGMAKRKIRGNEKMQELFSNAEAIYIQEACRPDDLYISLDDTHFIRYCDLASTTDKTIVSVSKLDGNRDLTATVEPTLIYNFQPFLNKKLVRPRKCVISYSKQDYAHLLDFKRHLDPIYRDGYIEAPWNCTELYAGITWDDEIQKRFNEADVIFYLISGNLMTTPYVLENEIKKGIQRHNNDPKSVKLVPIVISYYDWIRPDDPNDLGRFTGLPYTLRPVDTFENRDMIWYTISKSIKRMLEHDLDPLNDRVALGKEIESIYLEIIKSHEKTFK